jgi:hypothetical protein
LDISFSLFVAADPVAGDGNHYSRAVPIAENSQKQRQESAGWEISPPRIGRNRQTDWEHSRRAARQTRNARFSGVAKMLGKLFGAWLGENAAGKNKGAKGAILGYGAAALAKRSVPALAAVTALGWGWRKWREHKRSHASYPSEATPSS